MYGVEHGHGWVEATSHRGSGWRESETEKVRQEVGGRARRQGRTVTNRGLILEDRGLPHLVISHTCSEMGNGHPWRKTRAQGNTGRREDTKQKGKKQNRKKRRAQGLDRLEPTWRKKRRINCVDFFNEKKSVYLIIESFRIKRQSRKLPKPFSGTHQLQRKVLEPSAHTLRHTNPHTPKRGHRSSRNPNPKNKDSETHTHNNSVWSSFTLLTEMKKKMKETRQEVVPTKKFE